MELMLTTWVLHVVPAAALTAPLVLFGRKRVRWQWWELSVFFVPFALWAMLMLSSLSDGRKSLANCMEPLYFGLAIPVAAAVRMLVGARTPEQKCAGGLIATVCVLATLAFFAVPSLPE